MQPVIDMRNNEKNEEAQSSAAKHQRWFTIPPFFPVKDNMRVENIDGASKILILFSNSN